MITVPYFYPSVGGLENYVQHIARELDKAGWDVVVACGDVAARRLTQDRLDNLTVYRLPVWAVVSNTPVHLGWFRMLRHLIRIEKPDVIDANAPVPFMADVTVLASGRTPVVLTYHAGSMRKSRPLPDIAIRAYESLLLPRVLERAVTIVCSSDFIRDHFLRAWSHKSVTVTPGVDTEHFRPGAVPRRQKSLVFVGDFRDPRKGLDVLLEAVRGLSDVNLRVIGTGKLRPEPRVEFLGVRRGSDLVREIQQAEALVLPSTTEAEGFGMVLIEAMACATPVIASDVGGTGLAVRNGVDGLLVPPGDPVSLRRAIDMLLGNSALMAELGAAGRRRTELCFDWSARGQTTDRILRQAVQSARV